MPVFQAPQSDSDAEDDEKWGEVPPPDAPLATVENSKSGSRSIQRDSMDLEGPNRDSATWKRKWLVSDMAEAFANDFAQVPLKRRKLQDRRDRFGNLNCYELSLPFSDESKNHELKSKWVAAQLREVFSQTAVIAADYIEDVLVERSENEVLLRFFLSIEVSIDEDFKRVFKQKVRNHYELYPLFFGALSESESVGEGSPMIVINEEPLPKPMRRVKLRSKIRSKKLYRHGHFRASFGPNGRIVKCVRKGNKFAVQISQITSGNIELPSGIHRKITLECFDIHKTFHAIEENGTFAELCDRYSELFQKYSTSNTLSPKARLQVRHVSLAFDLIKILWQKPISTFPESQYTVQRFRRAGLDRWLKKVTELDVNHKLNNCDSGPEKIFWLLASNQKQQAIQHCWDIQNLRLASIISGCDQHRLRTQIRVWKGEGNWATFPLALRKCYLLLSGHFTQEVIEGLSWVQYLHLVLAYAVPRNASVEQIVRAFQHHFKNDRLSIPPPSYSFHGKALSIHFVILKLFSKQLNHLQIEPLGCTSSDLDFVWLWHLQDALHHFNLTPTSDKSELLYRSLIEQLERMHLWEYAVYVASSATRHKMDTFPVESACKFLLNLNYPRTKEMKGAIESSRKPGILALLEEEFDQEHPEWEADFSQLIDLGVAEEWIFGAHAILAMYEQDYEIALEKFMEAKDFPRAYQVLCTYELPRLVLDGHIEKALSFLKLVEENKDEVSDYETRAAIYQAYLQMEEHKSNEKETLKQLRELQQSLREIVPKSNWEDALISKMLRWSEQVESNLKYATGEVKLVGDLKMDDNTGENVFDVRSMSSHGSTQSSIKEKIHPLLLQELVELEVMDTYEVNGESMSVSEV